MDKSPVTRAPKVQGEDAVRNGAGPDTGSAGRPASSRSAAGSRHDAASGPEVLAPAWAGPP